MPARLTRYDGMIHGFFGMGQMMDQAKAAVREACANLKLAFGRRSIDRGCDRAGRGDRCDLDRPSAAT